LSGFYKQERVQESKQAYEAEHEKGERTNLCDPFVDTVCVKPKSADEPDSPGKYKKYQTFGGHPRTDRQTISRVIKLGKRSLVA